MTITTPAPTTPTTAAHWELAERVSQHMQTHFPDTMAAASWVVARDERDNTAVVVAQPGYDNTLPGGCRAIHLYRWHTSLSDAGFTCEGRTDLEVFGRPDEQSADGRARWIHVTNWESKLAVPDRSVSEMVDELKEKLGLLPSHYVRLDPADHPPVDAVNRQQVRADLAVFTYQPDGKYGGLTVTVYEDGSGYPVGVDKVPAWLREIGEAHRGHADRDSWCYLESVPGHGKQQAITLLRTTAAELRAEVTA